MATYDKQAEYGTYLWLRREVGGYLGFGYNPDAWDTERAAKVDSIVQSGLQQFYYPPPMKGEDGEMRPHKWTFLTPLAELSLVNGQREYDLPEDFSGIVNEGFTVGE